MCFERVGLGLGDHESEGPDESEQKEPEGFRWNGIQEPDGTGIDTDPEGRGCGNTDDPGGSWKAESGSEW